MLAKKPYFYYNQGVIQSLRNTAYHWLRRSESFFKTDMVYLAKGGFWLTAGQAISTLSAFALSVAFANLLSPESFGVYRYILSTMALLTIPAMGGIDTALTQAVAKGFDGSLKVSQKTKFRYGIIGSIASLCFSFYYFYNGNTELGISFLIGGVFLPYMESFSLYYSMLQGKKDFRTSSLYLSISQFFSVLITLVVLFFTKELPILVFAYFFSWTLARYISLKLTQRKLNLTQKVDDSVITYGKHLTLMGLLPTVANYIDRFLIFHFVGAAELAIYSIAIAPPEHIKALFKNVQNLALPKFSERTIESLMDTIWGKVVNFGIAVAIITVLYVLSAPYIFELLFPRYPNAVIYSQIISISLVTVSVSVIITALQAQKAQAELYKFNIWTSVLQITTVAIGVIFMGIMGVIIARVITRFLVLFITILLFRSIRAA